MKKSLVVLLSLGLVLAFSMSAFAVPADFTGQYYVRGYYIDNNSLLDQDKGPNRSSWSFVDQRFRLFPRWTIAKGLTLTMRFDALETIWGADQRTTSNVAGLTSASNWRDFNSPNISVERIYVTFNTGIGQFSAGNQSGTPYSWGTSFMNAPGTAAGVKWTNTYSKQWTVTADWYVQQKGDLNFGGSKVEPNFATADSDRDYYDLGVRYRAKGAEAGLLWTYFRRADTETRKREAHFFQPYGKFNFGKFDVEAEGYYLYGEDDNDTAADIDLRGQGLYVKGRYNMGPLYVGAFFAYASGDDPTTAGEREGTNNSTFGFSSDSSGIFMGNIAPAILFGYWYNNYITLGDTGSAPSANSLTKTIDNVHMYSAFAGYQANKKLDFTARYTYAKADEKPTGSADKDYGHEVDVQATYKIYDQLTYNIGAAYFWTGDYFKKTAAGSPDVENNYMLLHWIDLNF